MTNPAQTVALTRALEDYLETIYLLVQKAGYARVRDIARARDVKAGSVSPALKRLADFGLINYAQREYVDLTPDGEVQARRVLARHRLLTRFFHEILQMSPESADREACALEHSLSDEAMDRMVRFFEFLHACPNSSAEFLDTFHSCSLIQETPEPGCCGRSCDATGGTGHGVADDTSLFDLQPGGSGRVKQVNAKGAIRQRLLDMGILPEVLIEVERVAPSGDPVWIKLLGFQLALRRAEAEAVLVEAV